jgi:hypothetical protein
LQNAFVGKCLDICTGAVVGKMHMLNALHQTALVAAAAFTVKLEMLIKTPDTLKTALDEAIKILNFIGSAPLIQGFSVHSMTK